MRSARVDLYGLLGVAPTATAAEVRRAYRQMALLHHPDRAGAASAPRFAGIADAYRVLSNPTARLAYDASVAERDAWSAGERGPVHTGGVDWAVSTNGWRAARSAPVGDLLPRLSGRLDALVAARVAVIGSGGLIELHLNRHEAASGGTAAIEMSLRLVCATCGGVARPRGVWCRACEHDGQVTEEVTVQVRVPRRTRSGLVLATVVPRLVDRSLRVRFVVHGLRPFGGQAHDLDGDLDHGLDYDE